MSKDMRDSPRANLGFAASMFDATNYPHIPCTSTWLNHVKSPQLIANPTDSRYHSSLWNSTRSQGCRIFRSNRTRMSPKQSKQHQDTLPKVASCRVVGHGSAGKPLAASKINCKCATVAFLGLATVSIPIQYLS